MTGIPIIPIHEFIERARSHFDDNFDLSTCVAMERCLLAILFYSRLLQTPLREDMFIKPDWPDPEYYDIENDGNDRKQYALDVVDKVMGWLPMFVSEDPNLNVYLRGSVRDKELIQNLADFITLNPSWIKRENEDVFKILSQSLNKE